MNGLQHPEEEKAALVAKEGDAAQVDSVSIKSVDVSGGGAVVDERLLGRSPPEELGAALFGVSGYGGRDALDVGDREDGQTGKTKPVGGIAVICRGMVSC